MCESKLLCGSINKHGSYVNKKLRQGLKKIVGKFHGDPIFCWIVISEKQCYAAMKYIVSLTWETSKFSCSLREVSLKYWRYIAKKKNPNLSYLHNLIRWELRWINFSPALLGGSGVTSLTGMHPSMTADAVFFFTFLHQERVLWHKPWHPQQLCMLLCPLIGPPVESGTCCTF